ncbi:MAG: FAD-linked oxidase C-terminal domain-containing protein [Bacteroidota bacterium]
MDRKRSYWGWGYTDFEVPQESVQHFKNVLKASLQIKEFDPYEPKKVDELALRKPRFKLASDLEDICSSSNYERARHSYGKAFRDILRGVQGYFPNPPDYVAFPKSEEDIIRLMDFASKNGISLIPVGGGSSVCGGIEPSKNDRYAGVISVNMKNFNKILEVDKASRSAHIQGGMYGPALEAGLKPHGFTLRHFPQSFEFSTLGGWIATRAGGHFATLYTHIDEFVQSVSMITPKGKLSSRRLPGSGAGPSEERFYLGSEGIMGIITSAWMRLQDIPKYKKTITVAFPSFKQGAEAVRALSQSGLNPSNARLVDATEAFINGLGDGRSAILILGFESHQREVNYWMQEALVLCKEQGGTWEEKRLTENTRSEKGDAWKKSFLVIPYVRDELIRLGIIVETFETAITWDQFPHFYKKVKEASQAAIQKYCGAGSVTCRFTHIYPDGPAPYFSIVARGEKGKQLEQWDKIKQEVSQAVIDHGGTITHHHAVGKDHRPFYSQQHTAIFGDMLTAAKKAVDPNWIMNPGVLLPE